MRFVRMNYFVSYTHATSRYGWRGGGARPPVVILITGDKLDQTPSQVAEQGRGRAGRRGRGRGVRAGPAPAAPYVPAARASVARASAGATGAAESTSALSVPNGRPRAAHCCVPHRHAWGRAANEGSSSVWDLANSTFSGYALKNGGNAL